MNTPIIPQTHSRRDFLRASSASVAALAFTFPNVLRGAQENRKLKIGLIGCGGGGSGAVIKALNADIKTETWAKGEAFSRP